MTWIIFDEADRRIPAPAFRLPALRGEMVGLDDFRERDNLVLFFPHRMDCEACRAALQSFAEKRSEYRQVDSKLVVIFPEPLEKLKEDPDLLDLPFVVLSDESGKTRRSMANLMVEGLVADDDDLLLVLDQYGAPYAALIDAELTGEAFHDDILSWLEFIGVQCPE